MKDQRHCYLKAMGLKAKHFKFSNTVSYQFFSTAGVVKGKT